MSDERDFRIFPGPVSSLRNVLVTEPEKTGLREGVSPTYPCKYVLFLLLVRSY